MLHTTRRLDPLVPPPVKAEVERNTTFLEHGLIDDKHRLLEGNALVVKALTGVTAALSSLAASVDSLAGPSSPPLSPRKGRAYGGGFDPPLSEALLAGRAAGGAPVRRLVRRGGLFSDGDAEAAERVAKLLAIAMRATAYASE